MPGSKTDSTSSTDPRLSDPVARTALVEEVGEYIIQLLENRTRRTAIYPAVQARYPQLSERLIRFSILVVTLERMRQPRPLAAVTGS